MWEVLGRESLMNSNKKTELVDRLTPWDHAGVCIPVRVRRLQSGACLLRPAM